MEVRKWAKSKKEKEKKKGTKHNNPKEKINKLKTQ